MTSTESRTTEGRRRLYDSVLDTIGNTPCIRINALAPAGVTVYVKAEFFNPAASVKDRLAVSIIEEAERSGALKPGQAVVEVTSGNTGIGLAMVGNSRGYRTVIYMPDTQSQEKKDMLRLCGVELRPVPAVAFKNP